MPQEQREKYLTELFNKALQLMDENYHQRMGAHNRIKQINEEMKNGK